MYRLRSSLFDQVAIVYNGVVSRNIRLQDVEIDQQASLYNELFGWARIACIALMQGRPPNILYGSSDRGMEWFGCGP